MDEDTQNTTEEREAEQPITHEIESIEAIVSDPYHTEEQLQTAIDALMEKLESGDILQTPRIEEAYVQQMRDRISALIQNEAVDRVGGVADLTMAREKMETMTTKEGIFQMVRTKVQGALEERREKREEEETKSEQHQQSLSNCYGLVSDYVSVDADARYRYLISNAIHKYLESYEQLTDAGFKSHKENLDRFLGALIKKGTDIPGAVEDVS